MNHNQKPTVELLSPAGSFQTLKAVEAAGADAVYGAGARFGARAYAGNFSGEELLAAIDYMHIFGKRFYLTVNTLLKEQELQRDLFDFIEPLYRQGLDGVIVQDLGVLSYLRRHFPDLELHASTQMTITGAYGARLMKEQGLSRVVPARELSLEEIKWIHDDVDIEIESFVHGALCYCYSGQCLFSSMLGGRSGNRGRCAQPCRLPYETGRREDPSYLLSLKDLCTIELLPELLNSGICSLKIEGRMKQTEYAAGVTSVYREYLDKAKEHGTEGYEVKKEDLRKLEQLGSRSGFTTGYYTRKNSPEMVTFKKPGHTKSEDEDLSIAPLPEKKEKINGILNLYKENPAELVLEYKGIELAVSGDIVQKAKSSPMDRNSILEKMNKTGNSPFAFDSLKLQMEEDIFIPVGALNRLRREGLGLLEEEVQKCWRRDMPPTAEDVFVQRAEPQGQGAEPYLAVSVETPGQLQPLLDSSFVSRIYVDWHIFHNTPEQGQKNGKGCFDTMPMASPALWSSLKKARAKGKKIYYVMPAVFRRETADWYQGQIQTLIQSGFDGFMVKNLEELEFLKGHLPGGAELLSDSGLYCWSGEAKAVLKDAGCTQVSLPAELNARELAGRGYEGGELCIYGRQPLMVSAQCITKNTSGCGHQPGITWLTDRLGKKFPVKRFCQACYNVIYNTSPLSLMHQYKEVERLTADGFRLSFTLETAEEVNGILELYERAFLLKQPIDREDYLNNFTNGHLKRGVE